MDVIVWFVDTSVLCNLVDVPGRANDRDELVAEFRERHERGDRFVIPVTAIVETGNLIANSTSHARPAAERFVGFLRKAIDGVSPWTINAPSWDAHYLQTLLRGASTGQPLLEWLSNGGLGEGVGMGTGDLAILCERDEFRDRGRFRDVRIWTLERVLGAYS